MPCIRSQRIAEHLLQGVDAFLVVSPRLTALWAKGVLQNWRALHAGCPLLATSGGSGHVAGTTALPLRADLQAAMSASPPISSASPPGADFPGDAPVRLVLTHRRQTGRKRVMSVSITGSGRLARGSVRTGFSQKETVRDCPPPQTPISSDLDIQRSLKADTLQIRLICRRRPHRQYYLYG